MPGLGVYRGVGDKLEEHWPSTAEGLYRALDCFCIFGSPSSISQWLGHWRCLSKKQEDFRNIGVGLISSNKVKGQSRDHLAASCGGGRAYCAGEKSPQR